MSHRRFFLTTAWAILVAASGASAWAQAPLISVSEQLLSEDRENAVSPTGPATFALPLEEGQRVLITLTSDDFDPIVQVFRPGSTEPAAEDDDSGEGLNSRLVYTADRKGEHRIRVTSFDPGSRGRYELIVNPAPLPPPETRTSTSFTASWRLFEESLTAEDPEGANGRFDDYTIPLEAGDELVVLLDAVGGVFDPVVEIYSPSDPGGEPIDTNDDGGSGLGSALAFTAAERGDYVVRVTSYTRGQLGPYRLRLGRAVQ